MSQDPSPGPPASASDGLTPGAVAGVAAVPAVIALAIRAFGFELHLAVVLAGAFGWVIALVLRPVVAALAKRMGVRGRALQVVVVGSSGPLEEGVRLLVLMSCARSPETALSVGFGWATVEVAFTLVGSIITRLVRNRAGIPAENAQPTNAPRPSPAWGVLERLWASGLHLGFSLAIAAYGLLVVPAAAAHSATNLLVWRALSRGQGIARLEVVGTVWSVLVLLVASALWW